MTRIILSILLSILFLTDCIGYQARSAGTDSPDSRQQAKTKPVYETRENHDPDGIGKFYMGREIAWVMGHEGASWLERPDREATELPDKVVENMKLRKTDAVADVGAGTGYFTFRISKFVPEGKVYAVDIQPQMLAIIEGRKKSYKADNVITILGEEADTKLPENSVDAVLLVDAYHEFSFPYEMMQSIVKGLRPGGRVILIEYMGEDPEIPIKKVHKMTVAQARKELSAVGLELKENRKFLPEQHFMIFEKTQQK